MKAHRGFTLVEIVVIVAVIGVLIGLSVYGVAVIQRQGRDSKRAANAAVIAEALEKYYDKNGFYPGCSSMTASAADLVQNTLVGMDRAALLTPNPIAGATNSIQCADLTTATTNTDYFGYVVSSSAGCQTENTCDDWTLKYKVEETNSIASIQSRR